MSVRSAGGRFHWGTYKEHKSKQGHLVQLDLFLGSILPTTAESNDASRLSHQLKS